MPREQRPDQLLSQLADDARWYSFLYNRRSKDKPGEAILVLPPEKRELLKLLRSEDTWNRRPDSLR